MFTGEHAIEAWTPSLYRSYFKRLSTAFPSYANIQTDYLTRRGEKGGDQT